MSTPPVSPPLLLEALPPKGMQIGGGDFDRFWMAYPRHVAKPKARDAWDKAITKANPDTIIAAAASYRADPNREDKFTCHPTTWLNQERWEDDALPCRSSRPTGMEGRAQRMEEQLARNIIQPRKARTMYEMVMAVEQNALQQKGMELPRGA